MDGWTSWSCAKARIPPRKWQQALMRLLQRINCYKVCQPTSLTQSQTESAARQPAKTQKLSQAAADQQRGQTLRLNTKPLRRFSCAEGLYSNKLNAKLLNTLSSLCLTTKPLTKFLNFKVSLGTKSTRAVNFLHHAFSVDADIKRRRWMREFKVPKMKPSNHRNSPTYESDSPVSWSQFSLSPPPSSHLLWLVSVT